MKIDFFEEENSVVFIELKSRLLQTGLADLGPELSSVACFTGAQLIIFFASVFQWCCLTDQGSPSVMQHIVSVESSSLLLHSYLN